MVEQYTYSSHLPPAAFSTLLMCVKEPTFTLRMSYRRLYKTCKEMWHAKGKMYNLCCIRTSRITSKLSDRIKSTKQCFETSFQPL